MQESREKAFGAVHSSGRSEAEVFLFRSPAFMLNEECLGTDDRELVRRCVAGEQGGWDEFVRRTRSAILRGATVALRKFRVSDRESIENVHQQVYVELLRDGSRTLRSYRAESDLEGWVAVIA